MKQARTTRGRRIQSRRLRLAVLVGVGTMLAAILAVGARSAASDDTEVSTARFAKVDAALLAASSDSHSATRFVPASLADKPTAVILQLPDKPVAVQAAEAHDQGKELSPSEKVQIRSDIKSKQDAIKPQIQSAGGDVVGQMQDAYNGVLVSTTERNVPQLATVPGIVAVHAVKTFEPTNVNGVPFIGAPIAWGTFNKTGHGIKIGIIDSGIDYTHANFAGPGTPAAYAEAKARDTAPANPAWFGPNAPKVKGGFDFVGDDYNADPTSPTYQPIPRPDPNPLDCVPGTTGGHGSHVAGTAAGFGVLANGERYKGDYNATTIPTHSWTIGPGVAPRASLYAYRVFGCNGSTDVVALAINQAVKDGMDVINMSLGAPFGGQDDPTTVAANNAVHAGTAVIASAGNSGPNAYMVGSPSTGDRVLSAAAMDGTVPTYPGAHFALSNGKSLDALNANGQPFANGTTLPVVVVKDATEPGGVSLGCSVAAFQAANVAGKLAVVQRGTCARVAKAIYGQQAGAAAVAMINNAPGYPPFEGKITSNPDTGQPFTVTIPFFGIQGPITSTDAQALISADGGTVTLTNTTVPNLNYKTTASFSSGGPRNPDSAPKPDVIAPGVSVVSTGAGTGNQGATFSGTSMAAPMTSGTAALVKEAHHSWKGDQIKAAIENTADPTLNLGYNVRLAGAGVVQAQKAVDTTSLATTADHLDSLAFGYVPGSGNYSATKSFQITNYGSSSTTFNISVDTNGNQRGSSVAASPSSVEVPAGATRDVKATLSIPTSAFAALPGMSTFTVGPGGVVTIRGAIVATPTSGGPGRDTLRVPYLVVPRGLSDVAPGELAKFTSHGDLRTTSTTLRNSGIHTGTADLYAWGIHDAKDGVAAMDIRDVGVQSIPDGSNPQDRDLVFAINNYGKWANGSVNEYDVAIDTNGDGTPDFIVVGADLGLVTTGTENGIMASFTVEAATGNIVDAFLADSPMNGSTILLPTLASDLGLDAKKGGAFTYWVNGFNNFPGAQSPDKTDKAKFDVFNPGVSSGDFLTLAPSASATLPLSVNKPQFAKQREFGWLVVTLDDANGAPQADEVPLSPNIAR